MRRLLACVLLLVGFLVSSCEELEGGGRDARLNAGPPQVEVIVQQ